MPRWHSDSWRQVSSPIKVRAAVAAVAAAEAAAGAAEPVPNPMHIRSDGAGTVLMGDADTAAADAGVAAAADDDTLVIELVNPGR